jgi:polyferredoxin
LRTSLVSAGIAAFLLLFLIGGGGGTTEALIAGLFFALVGGASTFWILRTGRVNTPRLILFVGMMLTFTAAYSIQHEITRGSILLTDEIIAGGNVAICPITIPFVVPALIIRGEMIFPASVQTLIWIGLFWFGFALLFGRGWCSWLCFFGGVDQACATVAKRPRLEMEGLSRTWRLFPYAFLLFLILVAVSTLRPIYCEWLCPLRIAYDPPAVNTTLEWLMAVIFIGGGMIFLIGGPFLTKKRLYCSLICPLLPVNTIIGNLSPFRVKVDLNRCNDCGKCEKVCETFSMTAESRKQGKTMTECVKCGRCMDICPQGAIDYRLIGTNVGVRPIFVILAVVFNLLIMSGFVMALVHFLLTGEIESVTGGR